MKRGRGTRLLLQANRPHFDPLLSITSSSLPHFNIYLHLTDLYSFLPLVLCTNVAMFGPNEGSQITHAGTLSLARKQNKPPTDQTAILCFTLCTQIFPLDTLSLWKVSTTSKQVDLPSPTTNPLGMQKSSTDLSLMHFTVKKKAPPDDKVHWHRLWHQCLFFW